MVSEDLLCSSQSKFSPVSTCSSTPLINLPCPQGGGRIRSIRAGFLRDYLSPLSCLLFKTFLSVSFKYNWTDWKSLYFQNCSSDCSSRSKLLFYLNKTSADESQRFSVEGSWCRCLCLMLVFRNRKHTNPHRVLNFPYNFQLISSSLTLCWSCKLFSSGRL